MGVKMRSVQTSLSTTSNWQLHFQRTQGKMHPRPFQVGDLFHKVLIVVALIILLGDAGNPISLRGKKGKI